MVCVCECLGAIGSVGNSVLGVRVRVCVCARACMCSQMGSCVLCCLFSCAFVRPTWASDIFGCRGGGLRPVFSAPMGKPIVFQWVLKRCVRVYMYVNGRWESVGPWTVGSPEDFCPIRFRDGVQGACGARKCGSARSERCVVEAVVATVEICIDSSGGRKFRKDLFHWCVEFWTGPRFAANGACVRAQCSLGQFPLRCHVCFGVVVRRF